jgi:hypothetical protein
MSEPRGLLFIILDLIYALHRDPYDSTVVKTTP